MTLFTPETEIALTEARLGSLVEVVAGLREQIQALVKEAETGGKLKETDVTKVLADLRRAVVQCTSMEEKLDEIRNKQAGITRGGQAIDMAQARADIGCKLDKLRACCDADAVSE